MAAGAARRDAAGSKRPAAGDGTGSPPKNSQASELEPSRPKRAATTQEARLAHMLGKDGELAAWLIKNPSALAKVAKQKVAAATPSAGQSQPNGGSIKRKRVQIKNTVPQSDDDGTDDDMDPASKGVAEREASPELSGSDYAPNDGEDGEEESDGGMGDDMEDEDEEELGLQEEAEKVEDVGRFE